MLSQIAKLCTQFFLIERRQKYDKNSPYNNLRKEKRTCLKDTVETYLYCQTLETLKTDKIYGNDAIYSHALVYNRLIGIDHKADQLLDRQKTENLTMDTIVYEMLTSEVIPSPLRKPPELLLDFSQKDKQTYINSIDQRR